MSSLLIAVGVIALIAFILVQVYNKFVKNRNVVKDAWSNIDVALKRRHDLIPNLVETVKGYATHEKETFENVVKARNAAMSASGSGDINAQIKAEGQLQQELDEIEVNLERSRRYYNGTVRENNTYGESFPAVLFAGMFNYQHFDYFEVEDAERENITVSFN